MKPHLRRALQFIADHPGEREPYELGGYHYNFPAPEVKRAPFRATTVNELVRLGLVSVAGRRRRSQKVTISEAGRLALAEPATLPIPCSACKRGSWAVGSDHSLGCPYHPDGYSTNISGTNATEH